MPKSLKVWGGRYLSDKYGGKSRQTRILIAAYTKKQACEMANISYSEITNYFSLTGNGLEIATANEVGLWIYDLRNGDNHFTAPIVKLEDI